MKFILKIVTCIALQLCSRTSCMDVPYGHSHNPFQATSTDYIASFAQEGMLIDVEKMVHNGQLIGVALLFKDTSFGSHNTFITYFLQQKSSNTTSTDATKIHSPSQHMISSTLAGGGIPLFLIARGGEIVLNSPVTQHITFVQTLHNKQIVRLYDDSTFVVSQSAHPTIRFWQNTGGITTKPLEGVKELSRSFLLGYMNGTAIWATRDIITGKTFEVHIGFGFKEQEKSLFFKNRKNFDFSVSQELFSLSFINPNQLPACFVSAHLAIVFNEKEKQLVIVQYERETTQKKSQRQSTSQSKIVGTFLGRTVSVDPVQDFPAVTKDPSITVKTLSLAHAQIDNTKEAMLSRALLARTPLSIECPDNKGDQFFLVYDDRIVRITLKEKGYACKEIRRIPPNELLIQSVIHEHALYYITYASLAHSKSEYRLYTCSLE